MFDGEDWYDKEEWGFMEDLKKGQDEEEEDMMIMGKKIIRVWWQVGMGSRRKD